MDFKKYTGYFHDGTLIGVRKKENNMEIFLESCEISSDEFTDKKKLSKANTLKGKLCLIGIKWIKVDEKEGKEIPCDEYDDGEILRFRMNSGKVFFLIEWKNFPPKPCIEDIGTIEIEAKKIYWKNIPELPDNYRDECHTQGMT